MDIMQQGWWQGVSFICNQDCDKLIMREVGLLLGFKDIEADADAGKAREAASLSKAGFHCEAVTLIS